MKQITTHKPFNEAKPFECGGCRGYDSQEEREKDIEQLRKEGFNYFYRFSDTSAPIALCYGWAAYADPNYHFAPVEQPKSRWYPQPGNRGYDCLC